MNVCRKGIYRVEYLETAGALVTIMGLLFGAGSCWGTMGRQLSEAPLLFNGSYRWPGSCSGRIAASDSVIRSSLLHTYSIHLRWVLLVVRCYFGTITDSDEVIDISLQ